MIKIKISKLPIYYLSGGDKTRSTHMSNTLGRLKPIPINSNKDKNRLKSISGGFIKLMDTAFMNQEGSFKPIVILEDDVSLNRDIPKEIEIPKHTDILYIGISRVGMNKKKWCRTVTFKNYNKDLIRISNMLTTHGFIIVSKRGFLAYYKCFMESYFKNKISDILLAKSQPYLWVYALKNPIVYQDKIVGGKESNTKINYIDKEDVPLPIDWIDNSLFMLKVR